MMNSKNVPKIRFKEFSEEWVEKSFGEFGFVAMNKRIYKDQTSPNGEVPFYKIGTFGETPDSFISRELFNEFKKKYPYPQIGDILISASGSIGRTVEHKGQDEYFQDSNIIWLAHDERLCNIFLKQIYTIIKWSGLEGSTIKRLYNKNILETTFNIPNPEYEKKSITEQKQIGNYFQNIDTLINTNQNKLDKLKNIKKACLEKMFPKKGATIPKIRFKGFTGEWEEKKLGEVIDLRSGRDYKHLSEGCIPVYGTGGYMLSVNEALSYNEDAVGIGRKGTINKPYILYAPFWTVDTLFYAVPKNSCDLNFAYNIFQQIDWQKKDESTGVPSLSKVAINAIEIYIVKIEEQTQIGNYFQNLDNLIAKQERQLTKLKNIKKGCLERMFVNTSDAR